MVAKREWALVCDECPYVAANWAEADDHESQLVGHWVQQVPCDTEDSE